MVETELVSLELYRKPIFWKSGWKSLMSWTIWSAGMLFDTPVMSSLPSPVRPAASGSLTAANTMGTPLPSKAALALCAPPVAMGTRMSISSFLRFCMIVVRAELSPFAFSKRSSMSGLSPSSAAMVSRIWSSELWLIGWTMATVSLSEPLSEASSVPPPQAARVKSEAAARPRVKAFLNMLFFIVVLLLK